MANNRTRVGEQVLFSGSDIFSTYYAEVVSFKPLTGPVVSTYAKAAGLASYNVYHSDTPTRTLELVLYVGGETDAEAEENVSRLIAAARDTVITRVETGFEYPATLTQAPADEETGVEHWHKVTLRFSAIKRGPLETQTLNGPGTVMNDGTERTGVRLSLVCSEFHESVNLAGVTINNVVAGTQYVIDGIAGRVTAGGENYLSNTDLYEFPKLEPGTNTLTVPSDGSCVCEWYPVYT
jgi:hypothetical protein